MGRKSVPWPPNFSSSRKRKRRKEKQRQPWTCRSQSTPQPGDPRRAQRHLRGTSLSPFLRSHLREFARAALPQQRTLAGSDDSTPGGWPVAASSGLAPSRAPPAASGSSLASARPLVFAGITSVAPASGSRGVPLRHIYLRRTLAMWDWEPLYSRTSSS